MSIVATALLSALPLTAGWAVHVCWLGARLNTARRDPLTGLRTREGFTRRATALLKDSRAVVVLADVDHVDRTKDEQLRVSHGELFSSPVRDMQLFEGGAACLHPTRSPGISSRSVLLTGGGSCLPTV